MTEDEFLKRFKAAKQRRENWNDLLTEAYDLYLPDRQTIVERSVGQKRKTNLFDNTGVNALQEFANAVKQSLLPSHREWAQLKPSPRIEAEVALGMANVSEKDELARALGVLNKSLFQYIWDSNFDTATHEAIQDMGVSTGALLVLDSGKASKPLNFVSVPSSQLYPEAGANGTIETVFREHKIPARDIYTVFHKADADKNIDQLVRSNGSECVEVIEGTLYNSDKEIYEYVVYIKAADRSIFFEDIYEISPWVIFRSNVAPDEVLGRGPAIDSLPAMRTLNKLSMQLLYGNDMAINPPLVVNYGAGGLDIGNVNINPGSILPSDTSGLASGAPYQYLQTGANFNVGIMGKEDLQQQVVKPFAINHLGSAETVNMSATEAQIRNTQALSQQAAMFGRLNAELVQKLIKRCYYVVSLYDSTFTKDLLTNPAMEVVASSPLARVQDQSDLDGVMQFLNLSMGLGEMGQAMFASTVDVNQLGVFLANKMGIPANLMLSDAQRKQLQQAAQGVQQ